MQMEDVRMSMTYYAKLVRQAAVVMERFPRSTVALDAESLAVLDKSRDSLKLAKSARKAVAQGRTPVIIEKPKHEETWIL